MSEHPADTFSLHSRRGKKPEHIHTKFEFNNSINRFTLQNQEQFVVRPLCSSFNTQNNKKYLNYKAGRTKWPRCREADFCCLTIDLLLIINVSSLNPTGITGSWMFKRRWITSRTPAAALVWMLWTCNPPDAVAERSHRWLRAPAAPGVPLTSSL